MKINWTPLIILGGIIGGGYLLLKNIPSLLPSISNPFANLGLPSTYNIIPLPEQSTKKIQGDIETAEHFLKVLGYAKSGIATTAMTIAMTKQLESRKTEIERRITTSKPYIKPAEEKIKEIPQRKASPRLKDIKQTVTKPYAELRAAYQPRELQYMAGVNIR